MITPWLSKTIVLASLALVVRPVAKRVQHDPIHAPFQQTLQIKPRLARKLESADVASLFTIEPETLAMCPPNENDVMLALYVSREELSELRTGFIQFGAFMRQQADLNKHILDKLEMLTGEMRAGEDTKKNLQIADLQEQLRKRDAEEKDKRQNAFNSKWALVAACVALSAAVLGGGCSLGAAWMSYKQPSFQTINAGSGK
jgi:hypothetical protein